MIRKTEASNCTSDKISVKVKARSIRRKYNELLK